MILTELQKQLIMKMKNKDLEMDTINTIMTRLSTQKYNRNLWII